MPRMRPLLPLALALLCALPGAAALAEVTRCQDAGGNVTYTDGHCPSGSRQTGAVGVPERAGPRAQLEDQLRQDELARAAQERRAAEAAAPPAPAPGGLIVIDPRGTAPAPSSRGGEAIVLDDGYAPLYPYGGGWNARPPRNQGPRMRDCDARGCTDTQGNRYGRTGQLESYRSLDGRTCRPVNSTVVCR